ncbi:hypothetical protein Ade02nite_19390 [Paractinoplanes deccanensis]|uniref:Uncharacterized protein n=1 Tax=Paractinoplanes deccanensis TaxID=113561 RepID=A0ABQ3XZX2_9ACTN|nr:hypothetical protein Ade02nite_19390 [Actinoplanes deccanensis]
MIITVPRTGLVIAGCDLSTVNTRRSGIRCTATGFASRIELGKFENPFERTKMNKARSRGAGTPQPHLPNQSLPTNPEGGQAMQKPRPRSYRLHGRPAATSECHAVVIMTVTLAVVN